MTKAFFISFCLSIFCLRIPLKGRCLLCMCVCLSSLSLYMYTHTFVGKPLRLWSVGLGPREAILVNAFVHFESFESLHSSILREKHNYLPQIPVSDSDYPKLQKCSNWNVLSIATIVFFIRYHCTDPVPKTNRKLHFL